ncbi:MAG TPA: hypothetical protein VIY86_13915, partial [Pirellulaceae bacterium]
MTSRLDKCSQVKRSWAMVVSNGLAIGIAIPFGEHMRQFLTPSFGSAQAFTISLIAVGALGGVL